MKKISFSFVESVFVAAMCCCPLNSSVWAQNSPMLTVTPVPTNQLEIVASPTLREIQYQLLSTTNFSFPFTPESEAVEATSTSLSWLVTIDAFIPPPPEQGLLAASGGSNEALTKATTQKTLPPFAYPELPPLPENATKEELYLRIEALRVLTGNHPPLPPTPLTAELAPEFSMESVAPSPPGQGGSSGAGVESKGKFYRVVALAPSNGLAVTITSPSSGTVVSGYAPFEVQAVASVQGGHQVLYAALYDNETNRVGYAYSASGLGNLGFQIQPAKFRPGSHTFRVEVIDDSLPGDDGRGNVAYSQPITVTFNHSIWFADEYETPGLFHPGGSHLYASVLTSFPFGFLQFLPVAVYDPTGAESWSLLSNPNVTTWFGAKSFIYSWWRDEENNAIHPPDPYYDVVVSVDGLAASGAGISPAAQIIVTNRYFIETLWPTNANEAIVMYQNVWGEPDEDNDALVLKEAMDRVSGYYREQNRYTVGPRPQEEAAFRVSGSNRWTEAFNWLPRTQCRNLFYFGHGSRFNIGLTGAAGAGSSINVADLLGQLGNTAPFGLGANAHPYRSAIIIGCNAARKNASVFEALLGIPQDDTADKLTTAWFAALGIPPRAGVGFEDYKFSAGQLGNVIIIPNTELVNGTERLVEGWAAVNPVSGNLERDLDGAVTRSQTDPGGGPNNSMKTDIRIIGDKTLKFY